MHSNKFIPASTNLKEYVIIITGASRGIGEAIAEVLGNEGASLVLISRNISDLRKNFGNLNNQTNLLLEGNVSNEEDVKRILSEVVKKFGKIDVLVNNAGIFIDKPLDKISVIEFENILNINLKGIFLMSKATIPIMKKRKSGYIINMGSKISHNTSVGPGKVLYATSKYAAEGFSTALNNELKSSGIRVTCLMPGTVSTFPSLKNKNYLSPLNIGQIISTLIKFDNIDIESIIFKSKKQIL